MLELPEIQDNGGISLCQGISASPIKGTAVCVKMFEGICTSGMSTEEFKAKFSSGKRLLLAMMKVMSL